MIANIKMVTLENKKDWDELLLRCSNVNMLQTWEYGEAKKNTEGWIPVRSMFVDVDKPIGIAQTLTKKIPLLGGIARINRAPIIISTNQKSYIDCTKRILQFLYYYWVKQKKMVLFIAPNISQSEICQDMMYELGYNRTERNVWKSIIIDLYSDEVILRHSLRQKWRNLLNKSEKIGLELEIGNSDDDFTFLIEKYEKMKKTKNFAGMSEKLILEIKNVTFDQSSMLVVYAVKDGVRVGGILVLGCFDTCHYLISWNSPEGRNYQSNYFLLWQAILIFKKRGYRWFDLGGIDEKLIQAITHFKRGLGGKEYALIGEYKAFPQGFTYWTANKFMGVVLRCRGG